MERDFGKYRIERELGRGAASVVYLAVDRMLGRRIALKVLVVPAGTQPAERQAWLFL